MIVMPCEILWQVGYICPNPICGWKNFVRGENSENIKEIRCESCNKTYPIDIPKLNFLSKDTNKPIEDPINLDREFLIEVYEVLTASEYTNSEIKKVLTEVISKDIKTIEDVFKKIIPSLR